MKNMFTRTIIVLTTTSPTVSFTGWKIPFPCHLLFKHLMDYLTTLWVPCLESPKLPLLVTKPPALCQPSSATFDTHLPIPCHVGATHNEIAKTTLIQIPSLLHVASYQLCGLGNFLTPLKLSFFPCKMELLRWLPQR